MINLLHISVFRFLFDIVTHPRALDVVSELLGSEDIVLLSSTIFTKYPPEKVTPDYEGDFVGWHQDLRYWGLESAEEGERVRIINMWMAVDAADESNGAMQFLQGSHTKGYFEHVQSDRLGNVLNENQDMNIPEEYRGKIIQSRLRPGEASFHDGNCTIIFDECPIICNPFPGLVVHGSKASLARRRMGMTAQFTNTRVRMNPMEYTQSRAFSEDFRKPVLVRGQDTFGNLKYFNMGLNVA